MAPIYRRCRGFTLVEIIITLLAAGILGAIFINLMGTALSDSWSTVEMVRDEARGVQVMEHIIADYVTEMNSDPANALATLIANKDNGDYGPGVLMQYIEFDAAGIEVFTAPATSDTLKVTVQATGKTLTNIFTNCRTVNDPLIRY
ncbi:MAG: type II secretion system protein [Desulfobacterales bacterium]|jgi:prepilin-type N-terminal cleavage/methylation domain-containing protein